MIMDQSLIIDIPLDEGILDITQLIVRFIPIQDLTIKDMISTTDQLLPDSSPFTEEQRKIRTNDQTRVSFPLQSISSVPPPKPHERSYQSQVHPLPLPVQELQIRVLYSLLPGCRSTFVGIYYQP